MLHTNFELNKIGNGQVPGVVVLTWDDSNLSFCHPCFSIVRLSEALDQWRSNIPLNQSGARIFLCDFQGMGRKRISAQQTNRIGRSFGRYNKTSQI